MADLRGPAQESRRPRRRERARGVGKGRPPSNTDQSNDNAPSHRVFVGRAEIGAAWSKQSNECRDYLCLELSGPSFAAIFANLSDDEDGEKPSPSLVVRPQSDG